MQYNIHIKYVIFTVHGVCFDLAAQTWSISLNTETHKSSIFRAGYGTEISRLYVDEISQKAFADGKWLNN